MKTAVAEEAAAMWMVDQAAEVETPTEVEVETPTGVEVETPTEASMAARAEELAAEELAVAPAVAPEEE